MIRPLKVGWCDSACLCHLAPANHMTHPPHCRAPPPVGGCSGRPMQNESRMRGCSGRPMQAPPSLQREAQPTMPTNPPCHWGGQLGDPSIHRTPRVRCHLESPAPLQQMTAITLTSLATPTRSLCARLAELTLAAPAPAPAPAPDTNPQVPVCTS